MRKFVPKTKVCTFCGKRKPMDKEHYRVSTHGKYGYYAKCNACIKEYRKVYTSTPEFKKRHKEQQAAWRKKHPIKSKRIHIKAWHKNKHKYNHQRNEKYKNDPVFREHKYEVEKKYKASGRRQKMHRRRYRAKTDEIKAKSLHWKRENAERHRKYYKALRAKVLIHREREDRKNLADWYIVKAIKRSLDYKIRTKDIPKELIELERLRILTHRKLKQL